MHLESLASASAPASSSSADLAACVISDQTRPDRDQPVFSPGSARFGLPRILLAEDNDDLRSIARAFLQAEGYEVLACADGQRAISILRSGINLDLLLTDIEMPNATGIEVAAVAAALHPRLPIVIMSGAVLMESMIQQMRGAGWAFFQKPFTLPDMLIAVHERLDAGGRIPSPLVV